MAPAGLILAAGAGSRFGGTKQLADLHGRPLLEYAIEAMQGAVDRVVVVLGHEASLIHSRVDFGRAAVVVANDWSTGQAASLRRGISAVEKADAVVITLGDQPFITPEVITRSLALLPGYDAVRALYEGKPGHPVVFGRAVMDAVESISGDVGAREILADFRVNKWEASHLASAIDVDTVEELEAL